MVQKEYLQKQFEKFLLKNPVSCNCKPRYWNFRINDLFESLNAFETRLNNIKVCANIFKLSIEIIIKIFIFNFHRFYIE